MKIKSIEYRKTKSIGYHNITVGGMVELDEMEDPHKCYQELKFFISEKVENELRDLREIKPKSQEIKKLNKN